MSSENPQQIVRSWALSSGWRTGPRVDQRLTPSVFTSIATNFVQCWRETAVPTMDWGCQNFQVVIPQSIRILSAAYLQIELTGKMKAFPGLYCISSFLIRSGGQEVYRCNYADYLVDYMESLTPQACDRFAETYLGGSQASNGSETKTIKLPLLLPNSAYLRRKANSAHGNGVLGTQFGNQKLTMEITLNTALFPTLAAGDSDVTSIAGNCSIMYHTVEVQPGVERSFSDVRGLYNVITRRFTDLTQWTHYPNANTQVVLNNIAPVGCVTELMFLAVPHQAVASDRRCHQYIKANHVSISHDYVVQKELNTPNKIGSELWANGFIPPNANFSSPARLCFAAHCSEDMTKRYMGGYVADTATNLQVTVAFPEACDFKVVSIAYANCKIAPDGVMTSNLDGI
jgi:hypothetical protein